MNNGNSIIGLLKELKREVKIWGLVAAGCGAAGSYMLKKKLLK